MLRPAHFPCLQLIYLLHGFLIAALNNLHLSLDSSQLVRLRTQTAFKVCSLLPIVGDILVLHAHLRTQLSDLPLEVGHYIFMPLFRLVQVTLALVSHLLERMHQLLDFVSELVNLQGLLLVPLISSEAASLEASLRLCKFKLGPFLLHL